MRSDPLISLPLVTFVHPDGSRETHPVRAGDSVMDCALDHGVGGLAGQCGGGLTCSTCHCYVRAPWRVKLPEPVPDERELLSYVETRRADSRLGCQIVVTDALDGLVVHLPAPPRRRRA